jgi:hypothetical protein
MGDREADLGNRSILLLGVQGGGGMPRLLPHSQRAWIGMNGAILCDQR